MKENLLIIISWVISGIIGGFLLCFGVYLHEDNISVNLGHVVIFGFGGPFTLTFGVVVFLVSLLMKLYVVLSSVCITSC